MSGAGSEGSDIDEQQRGNNRRAGNDNEEHEGGGGREGGGDRFKGEELATRTLNIQSKRFYLDVKQNDRGRFIKFAEVSGGGRKSRVFMSMRTANNFKELLQEVFIAKNEEPKKSSSGKDQGPKKGGKNAGDDGKSNNMSSGMLHSEVMVAERRRYFFDLRENIRGRFLRITQTSVMDGTRLSIALPAEGMTQLAKALQELVDEFGEGYMEEPPQVELPESRNMRAENKYFYFDPGHNERGDFLKISEVKPALGSRQSITVPLRALPHFVDILSELMSKIQDMRGGGGAGGGADGGVEEARENLEKVAITEGGGAGGKGAKGAAGNGGKR